MCRKVMCISRSTPQLKRTGTSVEKIWFELDSDLNYRKVMKIVNVELSS